MNSDPFRKGAMWRFFHGLRALSRPVQLLIVLLLLLLAWLMWPASSTGDAKSAREGKNGGPVPVGAVTAKTGALHIYLTGLGTATPRNVVTVRSRVDGELMRVLFNEGQQIKAGDMIAEIDPRTYKAQLEQAIGQMTRDQALLADAKINLDRYKTLFAQDSIAKQQLDTQAALVKQYEGAVASDSGQVDNAKVQLAYTRITSPINGRVGLRQVDPGNIVHAGDANGIVVVTELQPITVLFTLSEDAIPVVMQRLRTNQAIPVEAWARDDKSKLATGTLLAVDNQADTTTGTVKLKAEFPNEDMSLFANQFVNVHMLVDTKSDAILIPSAAVQRGTQGSFVYVIKDGKTAALQTITTGPAEDENISVEKGVAAGDVVVVDGGDSLRNEAKIDLVTLDGKTIAKAEDKGAPKGDEKPGEHHKREKTGDAVPAKRAGKSEESASKAAP